MKILMSINNKFFDIEPEKIIELIKKYDKKKIIKGFEAVAYNDKDKNFIFKLAQNALKEGYIINLHSPDTNVQEVECYMDFASNLSDKMKRKINIVYHPINAENIEKGKSLTEKSIEQLLNYIKEKGYSEKIELSIENLNDMNGVRRLKKENLIEILEKYEKLKFTYDIGHEIVEGIYTEELQPILLEKMNNIHIHTFKGKEDHYPIWNFTENNTIKVKEMLEKVTKQGYNGNIVMEYALDYIEGNNLEERIINYIKSAEYLEFLKT